jgi:hypothetical protein
MMQNEIDRKVLRAHGHPCGTHSIVFGVGANRQTSVHSQSGFASVRRAYAATTLTRLLCTLRSVPPAGALQFTVSCPVVTGAAGRS